MSDLGKIEVIDRRIEEIKGLLQGLGPIRPGNLTQQYQDPKGARRPYWQISYTHKGKSRTDYIRQQFVDEIREQVQEYNRFRALIQEWTDLAIERSRLDITQRRSKMPKQREKHQPPGNI